MMESNRRAPFRWVLLGIVLTSLTSIGLADESHEATFDSPPTTRTRPSSIEPSEFRYIAISNSSLFIRDEKGIIDGDLIYNVKDNTWHFWTTDFVGTHSFSIQDIDRIFADRSTEYRTRLKREWGKINKAGPGPFPDSHYVPDRSVHF